MASTGMNPVVPGGAVTAVAVNYRLLGRNGVPSDELSFALGTQAIGSAIVLNALLWIALVASIPASGFHPIYATVAAVGAVLVGLFAMAVIGLRRGQDAVADRVANAAGHLPKVDRNAVQSTMLSLASQLDSHADDRHRLDLVLGYVLVLALSWFLAMAPRTGCLTPLRSTLLWLHSDRARQSSGSSSPTGSRMSWRRSRSAPVALVLLKRS